MTGESGGPQPDLGDQMTAWGFRATIEIALPARRAVRVDLDRQAEIPAHHCLFILPRADLIQDRITVKAGFQEAQGRGSIYVLLWNSTELDKEIKKGERICQGLTILLPRVPVRDVRDGILT